MPSPHGGYSTLECLRKLRDAAETMEARTGPTARTAGTQFVLPSAQAAWILRELVQRLEAEVGTPPDKEELHRTTQDALRRTLVSYYRANAQACAWLCDMELDPSGKLLGEVRQWAGTDPAPGEWRS